MKNYAEIIAREWNTPVHNAHIKMGEHAPLELHDTPSLIHVDGSVRMFKLLQEELFEYKDACAKMDLVEVIDAIFDMQFVLDGIKAQHGLHLTQEIFKAEILRSNLSKLTDDEMKVNSIGKVLKSATFSPPNIGKFL